jgi:hypothetical protein
MARSAIIEWDSTSSPAHRPAEAFGGQHGISRRLRRCFCLQSENGFILDLLTPQWHDGDIFPVYHGCDLNGILVRAEEYFKINERLNSRPGARQSAYDFTAALQ